MSLIHSFEPHYNEVAPDTKISLLYLIFIISIHVDNGAEKDCKCKFGTNIHFIISVFIILRFDCIGNCSTLFCVVPSASPAFLLELFLAFY